MHKTVRALKKSRGAFMTCLILGLLLVILAAAFSLYTNATKVEVFEAALEKADLGELMEIFLGSGEIPGLGGMFKGSTGSLTSSEMLSSFAQETIDYMVGKAETWEPSVSIMGVEMPLPISEDFMSHMEDVKAALKARQESLDATWSMYLPEQYELVKNSQTIEKKGFILYAVTEHMDSIKGIFEKNAG